jgi:hypothetical protein
MISTCSGIDKYAFYLDFKGVLSSKPQVCVFLCSAILFMSINVSHKTNITFRNIFDMLFQNFMKQIDALFMYAID